MAAAVGSPDMACRPHTVDTVDTVDTVGRWQRWRFPALPAAHVAMLAHRHGPAGLVLHRQAQVLASFAAQSRSPQAA